ncbi:MAG: c-type cytochrome, partial [Alphaproteobacteria bacterium]|nr:c-type cytochrome [Alphaproteobacteria bacterium]
MKRFAFVFGAAAFAPALALAQAPTPDLAAGKAKAEQVCAACHGANGVSVSAAIPNLAGQKQAYLASQLTAFKSGARKNAVMNAIAAQITPADIANVAAFYAGLQGASKGTDTSSMFPTLLNTRVKLPDDYRTKYTLYQTVNYPERPQVRHLYANDVAVKAAKDGKPMPNGAIFVLDVFTPKLDSAGKPVTGKDGHLEPDKISFTTVMEMQAGWGKDIPDL